METRTKPKLLIVHMSLYNGGAERSLLNFLTTLPADAFEVDLMLLRTEGIFLPQLPAYVRLLPTPEPIRSLYYNPSSVLPRAKGAYGFYVRAMRVLGNLLSSPFARGNDNLRRQKRWRILYRHIIPRLPGEYDCAMAYFHGEISYYVMDKVNARRKVAWVHNDYDKTGQSPAIDRGYFARFAQVASISALCVETLKRAFPGLENKFVEVPNLTSAAVVRNLSRAFEPPEYDSDCPKLLSVGRLAPQKASDLSVEAAILLKKRGVRFVWYLLGEGPLRKQITEMIRENGLEEYVRLLGVRANPYPYMRACDLFVQNSRYEGKSMVLDEAKILCKPILVTAYPTVADQIEADVEGLVVPLSAEAVADGIERMLGDSALRQSFSDTLSKREYGNTGDIAKYRALVTGEKDS